MHPVSGSCREPPPAQALGRIRHARPAAMGHPLPVSVGSRLSLL